MILIDGQVTWDEHSLKVNGERIFFYSGEVHPYRCAPGVGCSYEAPNLSFIELSLIEV
jgi:hypothetical protein